MVLYHGSKEIVEYPEIRKARFQKDFYFGFYCTLYAEQAKRWATRYGDGYINKYEYVPSSTLNCLYFEEMTEEWLDFIVACRNGKPHPHDIVIGAMANDQIWNYVADFISGILTREQFWILAKFKHPTHQIAFCSEKALSCLSFQSSQWVAK